MFLTPLFDYNVDSTILLIPSGKNAENTYKPISRRNPRDECRIKI
jgi:hypothetical protein